MDEINNAIQRTITRAEEKTQLIRNIIHSEISYSERKEKLAGNEISDKERADLEKYVQADEDTISKWMTDFNISIEDIEAVRGVVLTEINDEKQATEDKAKQAIVEQVEAMQIQLSEFPEKKAKIGRAIDDLKSRPSVFSNL